MDSIILKCSKETTGSSKIIPIFIMSYNDLVCLKLCLRAFSNRTKFPHSITIVDNSSTEPKLKRFLRLVEIFTDFKVFRNKLNLWVLGLNKPIREWANINNENDYFVVTDCDIIPPPIYNGKCWLERMNSLMDENACVGKLGAALDLGYIKTRSKFIHTYNREKFFMGGPRIGDLIIAPVDTTLAIYRKSLFVTNKPLFIPTHQGLYRPYYYCCRTSNALMAKHLSWRFYDNRSQDDIVRKIICFAIVGATVVPAFYNKAPLWAQMFYKAVRPLARLLWLSVACSLQLSNLIKHFPHKLNTIQFSRRA